jgi:hypothetical protein
MTEASLSLPSLHVATLLPLSTYRLFLSTVTVQEGGGCNLRLFVAPPFITEASLSTPS